MCGIAGLIWTNPGGDSEALGKQLVRTMTGRLVHRGPDAESFQSLTDADGRPLGMFGHRRLAIVDEAGGAQPFVDDDLVLIANCEIYDHRILRRDLERGGAEFRSQCDAEVILHGYRRWGDGIVTRLDGMFAFALWDRTRARLLLARDRLGQKPLYWCRDGDRFLFASEGTALIRGRAESPTICPDALARYLLLDFVPTPHSIFTGVHSLAAGTMLSVERDGQHRHERYFDLPGPVSSGADRMDVIEEIRSIFDDALMRRRMSDRPVGVFLSGGLDSSIVARGLSSHDSELLSYSIKFSDAGYDESAYARDVARTLGTRHTEVDLGGTDAATLAAEVLGSLDEPLADASTMAVWALSKRAAEDVKVVLGGDGADELFGGYDVFAAARLDQMTSRLGGLRPPLLRAVASLLGGGEDHFSFDFQLRQAARGLTNDPDLRGLAYTFNDEPNAVLRRMVDPPKNVDIVADLRARGGDLIDLTFRSYQGLFLESNILRKIDRAGMAHGLEIRSPFLDHRLVEIVGTLPARERLYGWSSKPLLREALGARAPKAVLDRRKHGFIVPIARWINSDLADWFDEIVNERLPADLIDRSDARALLQAHRNGKVNQRKPLWNLAALTLWHEGLCSRP